MLSEMLEQWTTEPSNAGDIRYSYISPSPVDEIDGDRTAVIAIYTDGNALARNIPERIEEILENANFPITEWNETSNPFLSDGSQRSRSMYCIPQYAIVSFRKYLKDKDIEYKINYEQCQFDFVPIPTHGELMIYE